MLTPSLVTTIVPGKLKQLPIAKGDIVDIIRECGEWYEVVNADGEDGRT
jgi:SH3-like domain-containing protein